MKMKDVPKKIYLQVGQEDNYEGESFKAFSEVTWCSDKIHKSDIEYILAEPEGKEAVEFFKGISQMMNDHDIREKLNLDDKTPEQLYKIWKAEAK